MAQTNVSSCVLSIVASFTSGLDVFKRFREVQRKRRTGKSTAGRGKKRGDTAAVVSEEEGRLARSLRQGPEDIGREYARSVAAVGDGFAGGDAMAQTSLAEILLRLNTGLVTIINSFLDNRRARGEGDAVRVDYSELTRLSDRSRVDTCRTLRQLCHRMRIPPMLLPRSNHEHQTVARRKSSPMSKQRSQESALSRKSAKLRGPTLARVVIANSVKPSQVALVRPGEKRKKLRSTTSSTDSSKVQSKTSLLAKTPPPPLPSIDVAEILPRTHGQQTPRPLPRKEQSAVDLSLSSHLPTQRPSRPAQSTVQLNQTTYAQDWQTPMPHSMNPPVFEARRQNKATPTFYSIETTSTKLGEIPLHKWAQPYDFDAMSRLNKEAERNGWPLSESDQTQIRRKKGLGFFRMFRRNRTEV